MMQYEDSSATATEGMMGPSGFGGDERVKVALRVRPMLSHELSRGDDNMITVPDS